MDRRKIEENIFKALMILATIIILSILVFILATVIVNGLPAMNLAMITQTPKGGYYIGKEGGILNAILGSLYLAAGATLLAILISLPIALYLNVYARRKLWLVNFMRFSFDVLCGIPSIVYGVFGFIIMLFFGLRVSLLAGIITVSLFIMPIIVRAMDEVIRMIPTEFMETSYALGATRLETTLKVVTKQALKDITVDIPDKKITAIIGPSGCGKTTLLKSFNRLIDSIDGVRVSGQVLVDGEDIFDPKIEVIHVRKKMGLLLQRPYPLPMSIYDNVAYGPRIHGLHDKNKLDDIVEHYLKEASLWQEVKDRLHASATKLSIGQQQRLCLARGLAVEPEIILADEPTSSLDSKSSQRIEQKFLELKDEYTIVIVTHILRQAKRLADYVIFL